MSIERISREYAELRIDLSRDALDDLRLLFEARSFELNSELENMRNIVINLLARFDAALSE